MSEGDVKRGPLLNVEQLFRSSNKELSAKYIAYFKSSLDKRLTEYAGTVVGGDQESYRIRALLAVELAQLGLTMFQFFGSCAAALGDSQADRIAHSAVCELVASSAEKEISGWIDEAKGGMN